MAEPRLSREALADLRNIRRYSKDVFGPAVALGYLNGLRAALNRLGDQLSIGIAEKDLGEGMRSLGYRSHRIYFRHAADDILIVRILHHAQDVPSALRTQS